MGGDSGSAWLIEEKGKAKQVMVGLHFQVESQGDPDDHAMACYAHSVLREAGNRPRPADCAQTHRH